VKFRFGGFLADVDTRQLSAGGTEVHLSPKAFDLLVTLIEHRSTAMSKAVLQDRLWPSTFVGETNLATLIAEIRRALGDSPQDSSYIRTVHRFGYRFVGAVEETAAPASAAGDVRMYLTFGERRVPLSDGTFVLGRAPEAAIRVDSGGVSRLHAQITVRGREALVEDLGSKNGTFVAGRPVKAPQVLHDGDELRIGPVAVRFTIVTAGPTETMA
jgi:DNA-binding winged helix-turn-helix (wHTH) protein